jgi:hypothetical protein
MNLLWTDLARKMRDMIVQDLPSNSERKAELVKHIRAREAPISHFYCDNMGFVTIGAGELVKTEKDAGALAASGIQFTHKTDDKKIASRDEIIEDWKRVHDKKGLKTSEYRSIAALRLSERMIDSLLMNRLEVLCRALYKARSFIQYYDPYIAMALVDTRYNPAGLHPWKKTPNKAHCDMWLHLDPCDGTGAAKNSSTLKQDLVSAVSDFETAWSNRGGKNKKRYQERHAIRVGWFNKGVVAETAKL